ncbi:MAG: GYDIA family GHMP kinase [Flavobacteriaceae bacterium]
MWTRYYSHGKLLLTGEYTVLDGSLSLALPTAFGQELKVQQQKNANLNWASFDDKEEIWFQAVFDLENLQPAIPRNVDSAPLAHRLSTILKKARDLNPEFLKINGGIQVETRMDFNRHWGLGSSSTLINNIAQWAGIDPYHLQYSTFGGSGYDIACAVHAKPLLFHLESDQPCVSEIVFDPPFKEQLFFVYLNRKQDSREGIRRYRALDAAKPELIAEISSISRKLIRCDQLKEFQELLTAHEILMASTLQLTRVQDELFPEYNGVVKSLGAWGGDFVLAASEYEDRDYFHHKGYKTVLAYNEMVL